MSAARLGRECERGPGLAAAPASAHSAAASAGPEQGRLLQGLLPAEGDAAQGGHSGCFSMAEGPGSAARAEMENPHPLPRGLW